MAQIFNQLTCPFCGFNMNTEDGNPITVFLNDEEHDCECSECGENFTVDIAVERMVETAMLWKRFAAWYKAATEFESGDQDDNYQLTE